jgi:tetratricopeptide (TPR) repeat protein
MAVQPLEDEFEQLNDQYPEVFGELDGWNFDAEEVLRDLLRALRRKKGFGLFFVQCNSAQAEQVMTSIRERLPQKRLQQFDLNQQSETLYEEMLERYKQEPFSVACITGVEQVLYGYEDTKRLAGWTSQEIYNYSWKGVPPLLSHLNRQREVFEANLPVIMVFLVRSFVIDYFIQRAPDFFDWRSGFFKFTESAENLQKLSQELVDGDYQEYNSLTPDQRVEKILEIKDKILQLDLVDGEQRSSLLREQGRLFQSGRESNQALDCYERSIAANPNNHKAWNNKGILLKNLKRYEEALKSCERCLEIQPDYVDGLFSRGSILENLKCYAEAIESYNCALIVNPDHLNSMLCRSIVLGKLRRYEEAIDSYDHVLNLKIDYYFAWDRRGDLLVKLGRNEEAIESYDKALKIKPDYYFAWDRRGDLLVKLGRNEEAIESYDKALKIKPDYHFAWDRRGDLLVKLGRNEEAIRSYDKALEIKPNYHYAWGGRGDALLELGRNEEAIESYDKVLEIKHDYHYAWDRRGDVLVKLGRNEEAIESYDKALKIKPDYHYTWGSKGVALYQLGKPREASVCFSKVAKIQPSDKNSWNNQGYLNLAQDSYNLQPIFKKPLLIRQHQYCSGSPAKADIDLERCQKSLALFETALQLDPKFILAWANRSFPAYYLQQYQTALQSCDRALELDPENKDNMNEAIHTNRGCILLQLQNPTAALQDFASALSLDPHLTEAWIGKGTALYQLGRFSEAHDSFSQALALNHPLAQTNLNLAQQLLEAND